MQYIQKLFPNTTEDKVVAIKVTTTIRTYNSPTIMQLGRCGLVIENNNKCKNASFLYIQGKEIHSKACHNLSY